MSRLVAIDGSQGEGGGQILRTALALSVATGQGFRIEGIRARRSRPGLRPQHVAAVHAASLACGARVGGCFEGSPDLRFEPGELAPGEFRHEIGTAGATTLVLQTVLPALARASEGSRVEVTGGTHVPLSPSYEFLARHWAPMVARLGLEVELRLVKAGYHPPGGGRIAASVSGPMTQAGGGPVDLESRGALVAVRVVAGGTRARLDAARRAGEAARQVLWERKRLDAATEVAEQRAASPGWFLYLEAEFECGRGAFGHLPQRRSVPDQLGASAARELLRFLEREEAVDPHLADQLVVPMALSRGGSLTTPEITPHLETVGSVVERFGVGVRLEGRPGGPGRLEIDAV